MSRILQSAQLNICLKSKALMPTLMPTLKSLISADVISGQSYKCIYDRNKQISSYYASGVVIYERNLFIRLSTVV